MSLFDVPELVDLVGPHLTSHDLTACVLVNKFWNKIFTPHLWRAGLEPVARPLGGYRRNNQRSSLCQMVLSDYLLAAQQQQGHHQEDDDSHNRPAWEETLTRNGRWVRELSIRDDDFFRPQSSSTTTLPPSETSFPAAPVAVDATAAAAAAVVGVSAPDPTKEELLSHLLNRCTNIQKLDLWGYISTPQNQVFWCDLIRTGLPTTTIIDLKLFIETICDELSITPALLIQGSTVLKKLTLQLECEHRYFPPHHWRREPEAGGTKQGVEDAEEGKDDEEGLLPSLKELSVTYDERYPNQQSNTYPCPPIWPRLLRRCPNLESLYTNTSACHWIPALQACVSLKSLEVEMLNPNSCRLLATAIKTHLPNLDTITIHAERSEITDEDRAEVVSACQKGWRSIGVTKAGPYTVEAVVKHCSTLEVLHLRKAHGLTSELMVQILSTSPRLETFVTLVEDDYGDDTSYNNEETHFLAEDFIDAITTTTTTATTTTAAAASDPLRPWACESTLKVFRAKINGIPRPDITQTFYAQPLKEGMVLPEAYPGHSLDLQGRVYERLARLTRLERLELGHEDRYPSYEYRHLWGEREQSYFDSMSYQYACLEMSLKSGLRRLEGLKELRVLGVSRMNICIEDEEKRWMRENWPCFEMIDCGRSVGVFYLK